MTSTTNNHAAVATADPTLKNSTTTTNNLPNKTSHPDPVVTKNPPKTTIPKIDAHFATLARENACSTSDRARHVYITRQLVDQFGEQFSMSEAHAEMAVEEEMKRRYKPNPWDGPALGRLRRQQRGVKGGERIGEGGGEGAGGRYSEEEWDRFECSLGYK